MAASGAMEDTAGMMYIGGGVKMQRSQYLAGFREEAQREYPTVPIASERFEFTLDGNPKNVAENFPHMKPTLYNPIKVCSNCGKRCSFILKNCDQCETDLTDVAVSQGENVFVAVLCGVRFAGKGFPYKVSLRYESDDVLVFDSQGSISTCNLLAISKRYFIPDWRFLLHDPMAGLQLLDSLEDACRKAMRPFLNNSQYRRFVFRDEHIEDAEIEKHIIRSFNFPASQNLLHLQWIVPPLTPCQHFGAERKHHFQEDRSFPLDYVRKILELNEIYPVTMTTPFEDIVQHFDARVSYKSHWAELYHRALDSTMYLQNWKAQDFMYIVEDGKVFQFSVEDSVIQKGPEVADVNADEVQKVDKAALGNCGRPLLADGKPAGTYIQSPLQVKVGEGGFGQWPGVEAQELAHFELKLLFVRHGKSYYRKILDELEPQLTNLHAPLLRVDVPLHSSKFEEAKERLAPLQRLYVSQTPPPFQFGSSSLRVQQSQVLSFPPENYESSFDKVKPCHSLRVDAKYAPASQQERLAFANDEVTFKEHGEAYVQTLLGCIRIGTACSDDDHNPSHELELEDQKYPHFLRHVLTTLATSGAERPMGDVDAVIMTHNFWFVKFVEWLHGLGAMSDNARNVLIPLIPEHRREGLPVQKNGVPKYCTAALCGSRFLRICGKQRVDGTLTELRLDVDSLGGLQDDGTVKPYGEGWIPFPEPGKYDEWVESNIQSGYLLVGV